MPNLFYNLALLSTCLLSPDLFHKAGANTPCNFTSHLYSGNVSGFGISDISILKDDSLFNISVQFWGRTISCNNEKLLCNQGNVVLPQNDSDCLVKNLNHYYIKPEIEYDEKQNQINIEVYGNDIILYPSN